MRKDVTFSSLGCYFGNMAPTIYSDEDKTSYARWHSDASKEIYLQGRDLELSDIFNYPDDEELQESRIEYNAEYNEESCNRLLDKSLATILSGHAGKNKQSDLVITVSAPVLVVFLGISFSVGYYMGIHGIRHKYRSFVY